MNRKTTIKLLEDLSEKEKLPIYYILRNLKIKEEYDSEVKKNPKIKRTELKNRLSNKYFISLKTIENIIYNNKSKK